MSLTEKSIPSLRQELNKRLAGLIELELGSETNWILIVHYPETMQQDVILSHGEQGLLPFPVALKMIQNSERLIKS